MSLNKKQIEEINDRIAIVKESIYGVFFSSNNPSDIAFNLVLNRLIILIQEPITFAIFKKISDRKYELYHSYVIDGTHKEEFDNELNNLISRNNLDDELFRIFNSEIFKIAVYKVNRKKIKSEFVIVSNKYYAIDFKINDDFSYIRYMVNRVFNGNYSKEFTSAVNVSIKNIINSKLLDEGIKEQANFLKNKNSLIFFKTSFEENKNKLRKNIDLQVCNTFNKVSESSKIINSLCLDDNKYAKKSTISNVLLFLRDYSNISFGEDEIILNNRRIEKDKNFLGYNYSIRICITERQKEEIEEFFKEIKKDFKNINLFSRINNKPIEKALDNWFIVNLTRNDNFIEDVVNILSSELGKYSRSLTEPIFQNSLVHIRKPFQLGGLDRAGITEEEFKITDIKDIPKDKLVDCQRIVICFYLFGGMVHTNTYDNLRIVMLPIELNGRVFGVCSHIIVNKKNKNNDKWCLVSNDVWSSTYHLYSEIGTRIERNLRKDLKAFIVDYFCKELKTVLQNEIRSAFEEFREIRVKEKIEYINDFSFFLSIFVPYGFVKITPHNKKLHENMIEIFFNVFIDVDIKKNIFFNKYRDNLLGRIEISNFTEKLKNIRIDLKNFIEPYINKHNKIKEEINDIIRK